MSIFIEIQCLHVYYNIYCCCVFTISFPAQVYPDVSVKEEPSSIPLHRPVGKGRGHSSNAPPTPWVPPLWKQQYENIRKMREARNAPVDTHGCFMLAEKGVAPEVSLTTCTCTCYIYIYMYAHVHVHVCIILYI